MSALNPGVDEHDSEFWMTRALTSLRYAVTYRRPSGDNGDDAEAIEAAEKRGERSITMASYVEHAKRGTSEDPVQARPIRPIGSV